jgi:hypothetical protein
MQRTSTNDAEKQALQLLEEMPANIPDVLNVRLWIGKLWPDERPRVATLVLHNPNTLSGILGTGTEAGLAEGYLLNDFDLEVGIEAAFECVDVLLGRLTGWRKGPLRLALTGSKLAKADRPETCLIICGNRNDHSTVRLVADQHEPTLERFRLIRRSLPPLPPTFRF